MSVGVIWRLISRHRTVPQATGDVACGSDARGSHLRRCGAPAAVAQGAGPGGGEAPGARVPGSAVRARPRGPVPAPGGDHPLGADDGRPREHGDARSSSRGTRRRRRWPAPRSRSSRRSSGRPASTPTSPAAWSGMAQALVERFDGEVPTRLDDLVTLPGVGRKTANVVRSVAFDLPGLPVDTHVGRLEPPARAHHRPRPREGRAHLELLPAGGRARSVQPADDPPRPAGVRRPLTPLRGVRPGRHLPVVAGADGPKAPSPLGGPLKS